MGKDILFRRKMFAEILVEWALTCCAALTLEWRRRGEEERGDNELGINQDTELQLNRDKQSTAWNGKCDIVWLHVFSCSECCFLKEKAACIIPAPIMALPLRG